MQTLQTPHFVASFILQADERLVPILSYHIYAHVAEGLEGPVGSHEGFISFTLVVDFYWLFECMAILIGCICSFGGTIRMLQAKVLFPSSINISSLKTAGHYI